MPDNPFMRRAIELAVRNVRSGAGGPFGAVIVRHGAVLAEGVNLVTSALDPTAHAEIVAIRRACRKLGRFDLAGCQIFATCEPCPMCLGAIYWAGLDRVSFAATRHDAAAAGFQDALLYGEIALPPKRRPIPMAALMRDEALEAFRVWRAKSDRVPY